MFQKLPEAPRGSQKLPEAPRGSQKLPNAPRGSQTLPEAPKGSQMLPEAPRSSQKLPDSSRRTDLKSAPVVPGSYQGLGEYFITIKSRLLPGGSCHTAWKPLSSFRPLTFQSLLRAKHQAWGVCPVLAVQLYGSN